MSRFMNDYDIETAVRQHTRDSNPNRLAAALVIRNLAEWADSVSDGWCYWPKPVRAAQRLIDLTDLPTNRGPHADCTDAELAAAVRPVKALLTRQGASADQRERILRASEPVQA